MERNRDLLPWILGGLSIATVAVAIAVGSSTTSNSVAPTVHAAPPSSAATALPLAPAVAPAAPVVADIAPAPESAPAPVHAEVAAAQEAPSGQIWTCTTHGVKTFSNNPCGEKSSLLDVGPINTMNATRVLPSRAYPPDMHFAPTYPTEDTPEQPDDANPSYGVALV